MASKILDPLVTKFILPEHAEMLRQYHEDKKLIEKPIIEEVELSEFFYRISDWIDKFDLTFKQIKLKNDEDFWWIPVEDVISVEA
ncbi:YolD-like family protein [Brevibacillus laterosporus]|uniref:YolD-like family protein n=1 Tax=Brevibacillus laterosporus TaxID=1465 RepID=UPI000EB2352A|nr:YolD-like family protein [Brevibacillus laterosporus]AYK08736.1 YolD-like family protein [Brevibacillus laterosporus]